MCVVNCLVKNIALYLNDFDEKKTYEDVQERPDSTLINKNLFLWWKWRFTLIENHPL